MFFMKLRMIFHQEGSDEGFITRLHKEAFLLEDLSRLKEDIFEGIFHTVLKGL